MVRYLKYFTFLSREAVAELEQKQAANPGGREAHRALAREVTTLIHGADAAAEAIRASQILFGGELEGVSETTFAELLGEVPTHDVPQARFEGGGASLVELLVDTGLAPSKGQARKDIEGGGVYLNNVREASPQRAVTASDLLFGRHLLLRKGKKNYAVINAL